MVFLTLAAISLCLHLIWEAWHIRFYTAYEKMEGRLPVFVFASLGDVLYTFFAIIGVSFFKDSIDWFLSANAADYLGLALIGFSIAVFVEYKAAALGRWKYTSQMPRLGGLGLTPLIQMTVLLPLSVFLTVALVRGF